MDKRRAMITILIICWVVFIILSNVPFIAEYLIDYSEMDDTIESHLKFPEDGKRGHYYVERYDKSQIGKINVIYSTESNSLEVDCTNIKVLRIYCREMYEKKSSEVFKRDPELDSNYYKTYFIERDHFHVHVYTEKTIQQLSFIDTPIPYNVTVNGQEWWLTEVNYTYNHDGIVLTKVPPGNNYVDIYFKTNNNNTPEAEFTVNKMVIGLGESIIVNASKSKDPDGVITNYVWDFGEGTFKGGITSFNKYTKEGNYTIILTVTDDDDLIDRNSKQIQVVNKVMNISKSVDKPIATPGSILTYSIQLGLNDGWLEGVKDIVVKDVLPAELEYVDAKPLPSYNDQTLSWQFGAAFDNNELSNITVYARIKENIENNTIITNNASLDYKSIENQAFPRELSNKVETRVNVGNIHAPKIINRVPDIEIPEDNPPVTIYLTPYEFDLQDSNEDLVWYITGENESLYIITGEHSLEDEITITPLPNANGNDLVTLWLMDSNENSASQPLWINITPVNDRPVFESVPDLILHYDDPYVFNYEPYISDIDNSKHELILFAYLNISSDPVVINKGSRASYRSTPEILDIDGFKIIYTFPEVCVDKDILVSLVVFDGEDNTQNAIQVLVTDDYTPKLTIDIPDVFMREGETLLNVFDLDDHFVDPDKDSLFYTFGETHVSIVINDDHSVDISSPSDWYGYDTVTFRARDPIGAIAEDTIIITVFPINDPPVLSGLPKQFSVHYEADYRFDLTPYISDKDNPMNDLFLVLQDDNIKLDHSNKFRIVMNYPKTMLGMTVPVNLTVSDGIDIDFEIVTVKITSNWPPELFRDIGDISFNEDETIVSAFNLNNYFSDKDGGTLFFSYGQKYVNITINPDQTVDFYAAPNWNGAEIVTFRATDNSQAFVEDVVKVTVLPVNDPPQLLSLPTQNGVAKKLWKFDLTDYIYDVDNDISELKIIVETNELEVLVSGRELVFYSVNTISENITVKIHDGYAETSQSMLVNIAPEAAKKQSSSNIVNSLLWIQILIIIIIISVLGYVSWRRYNGNYEVEEIYWIHDSGLLMLNISPKGVKHRADSDIMSSMLTGILDFTQEAFSDEDQNRNIWRIKEIQMSGKNLLVEKGEYTFLATMFKGKSGKKLYAESRKVIKNLENKYGTKIKNWDGGNESIKGAKMVLQTMIPN